MTHEIELEGYYPKILGSPMRMLCLGTKASYGMEALHFQRGTVTLPLLVACAVAAGGTATVSPASASTVVPSAWGEIGRASCRERV